MITNWIEFIEMLSFMPNAVRKNMILEKLTDFGVDFEIHEYDTGSNIIVKIGNGPSYIAITCHFDIIPGSGGANDNGAAIASCLGIVESYTGEHDIPNVLIIFFDEEETDRRGSKAYVQDYGIDHIHTLINMELVGTGDNIVLWPVKNEINQITMQIQKLVIDCIINIDHVSYISGGVFINKPAITLPTFPIYFSDFDSFYNAGLKNGITFTRVGKEDYSNAMKFLSAKNNVDIEHLISVSEILKNYHNKNDNSSNINNHHIMGNINLLIGLIEGFYRFKASFN